MIIPDFEMQDMLVYLCEDGSRARLGRVAEAHLYGPPMLPYTQLVMRRLDSKVEDLIELDDIVVNVDKLGVEEAKRRLGAILERRDYSKCPQQKKDFESALKYLEQVKEI